MSIQKSDFQSVLNEIIILIERAEKQVVIQANSALTLMFWHIGKRIKTEILVNNRASYGKQIVVTLSRQLSWSHFLILIPLKTEKEREYYSKLVAEKPISVRALRKQISKKAFQRTEIANIQIYENDSIEKGIIKDPYLLEFLELKGGFLENDLEKAILKELEKFLLELGTGFTFVERQKRMIIDGDDYYLDLLFYHRKMKRLVAIELKIDKFKAQYKGQMELYLKWLEKYEKQKDEQSPIGLILCAETNREQIELLEMHKDGIMVAEYWTEFLPKAQLEQKLHQTLKTVRETIERKKIQ